MQLKKIIATSLIPLNALLIFLLLFENRLAIPTWLQVAGRMHPLFLHFPIVLLVIYIFLVLFGGKKQVNSPSWNEVAEWLLLGSAFTAAITALMGLFLSHEAGYDEEALQWHKWSGIAIALFSSCWYWARNFMQKKSVSVVTAIATLLVLIFAGHQGAGITHGQNFLLAPILPEKQQRIVSLDEAVVFTHMVKPILESKCITCHNSRKAKGELIMETQKQLLKGGKHGVLWDSLRPDLSLLLKRIHLPLEQRKHMPPQGKPQLTEEEMQVLYRWIRSGADFTKKVNELLPTDTLREIAENIFRQTEEAEYDFDEADEKTIQKLSNTNRVIYRVARESPALGVNFFNGNFYNSEQLKELSPIKNQIVELDLSRMPVKDEDLKTVGGFINLRRLILNFTSITGASMTELKKLSHLKHLSLAGTSVKAEQVRQLEKLPQLNTIYVWNTAITPAEIEKWKQSGSSIKLETGFRSDTMLMKLTPPIMQNEIFVINKPEPLKLKHYIQGAAIRYTLDGTDPDSLRSPVYDNQVMLKGNVMVKAQAFKPGWMRSDIMQQYFFKTSHLPDTVLLLKQPDPKYKADGGKTLIDFEKGDLNSGSGKWLGYRNNRFEALLLFNQPVNVQSITLSTLKIIGGYIMPPTSVEVWGGNDTLHLKLLSRIQPKQPVKDEPGEVLPFELKFPATTLRFIKITATPVPKLPKWHPGKGQKGWVFVDEVLVN